MKIKKICVILLLTSILCIIFSNKSNATTPETLASEIYEMGYPYGMTEAEKVQIERDVKTFNVTQEQTDKIMEKAREMKAIFDKYGIYNLSSESKTQIKNIAIQAADIVDATLVFTSNRTCEIYKNGVLVDTAVLSTPSKSSDGTIQSESKLVYTGDANTIVPSIISIIALVTAGIVLKNRNEN